MSRRSLHILPLVVSLVCVLGAVSVWGKAGDYANRLAMQTERYADNVDDPRLADSLMQEAVRLYRAAADSGNSDAASYLGFLFYNGRGVERNIDSALNRLGCAAATGDVKAEYNLGWLLLQGEGVPHDTVRALDLIWNAAERNLPVAQATLGEYYLSNGSACQRDSALELLNRAAMSGFMPAQERIINLRRAEWGRLPAAEALARGLEYYKAEAPMVGVILFNIAIDNASRGMNAVADSVIGINPAAVTDSLRAIRGHAYALLGDAYSRNNGVRYNHALSRDNFTLGALDGNPSAQFVIGELLEFFPDALSERTEIPDSMQTAPYWLRKAADAGITDAVEAERRLLDLPH